MSRALDHLDTALETIEDAFAVDGAAGFTLAELLDDDPELEPAAVNPTDIELMELGWVGPDRDDIAMAVWFACEIASRRPTSRVVIASTAPPSSSSLPASSETSALATPT